MVLFLRFIARLLFYNAWIELDAIIRWHWNAFTARSKYTPPLIVLKLLVSGEDHRNGRHSGIDFIAIMRAAWRTVFCRKREGGSTIEQQLVRVLTGRFEHTISRKIREILLATLVADVFDKRIIASVYLVVAYYGWKMNGFSQACSRLRLIPYKIDSRAAAALVARLKYPQPRIVPDHRIRQIECRSQYLLRLYEKHVIDGTYSHLEVENGYQTVCTKRKSYRDFISVFNAQ